MQNDRQAGQITRAAALIREGLKLAGWNESQTTTMVSQLVSTSGGESSAVQEEAFPCTAARRFEVERFWGG